MDVLRPRPRDIVEPDTPKHVPGGKVMLMTWAELVGAILLALLLARLLA